MKICTLASLLSYALTVTSVMGTLQEEEPPSAEKHLINGVVFLPMNNKPHHVNRKTFEVKDDDDFKSVQVMINTNRDPCWLHNNAHCQDNNNNEYDESSIMCGDQANGATCSSNLCCSGYGYCGSSSAYCGGGCQSGPCDDDDDDDGGARYNRNYCGSSWNDANDTCGKPCPRGTNAECNGHDECYANADSCPAILVPNDDDHHYPCDDDEIEYNRNYCGSSWDDADSTCGRACPRGTDAECQGHDGCYAHANSCPAVSITHINNPTCNTVHPPTLNPTLSPSIYPTISPTTSEPSTASHPTTLEPTVSPSIDPTLSPSLNPTISPTDKPTLSPSIGPTLSPSLDPTVSLTLSVSPTASRPTTISPTISPSSSPTLAPSISPTISPTMAPHSTIPKPTMSPTLSPSTSPTLVPSAKPTPTPTPSPFEWKRPYSTLSPSISPSVSPTNSPTLTPPSTSPSVSPTSSPTVSPTLNPSISPTVAPTISPTESLTPTEFGHHAGKLPINKPRKNPAPHPDAIEPTWSSSSTTSTKSSKKCSTKSSKGSKSSKSSTGSTSSSTKSSKGSRTSSKSSKGCDESSNEESNNGGWGGSDSGNLNKVAGMDDYKIYNGDMNSGSTSSIFKYVSIIVGVTLYCI